MITKVVEKKSDKAKTAKEALDILIKGYGEETALQMVQRGEYDVVYRTGRREVDATKRKTQKKRIELLEAELRARKVDLSEIDAKLK